LMQLDLFNSLDSPGKLKRVLCHILCSSKTSRSNEVSECAQAVWVLPLDWRRYPEIEF
jgi:hypothetical protein